MNKYKLVFGSIVKKKLEKLKSKKDIKLYLSKIFNKIENLGPNAGKLLDNKLYLYEVKMKNHSLRIFFQIVIENNIAKIIDFEIKKSEKNQNNLIEKIKEIIKNSFV